MGWLTSWAAWWADAGAERGQRASCGCELIALVGSRLVLQILEATAFPCALTISTDESCKEWSRPSAYDWRAGISNSTRNSVFIARIPTGNSSRHIICLGS